MPDDAPIDLPAHQRRYAITFSIRSGSTLLCEDLAAAGLGSPTEHFQPHLRGTQTASEHLGQLLSAAGPVFGTKLAWEQAYSLMRSLSEEGVAVPSFDLRNVFGPELRVIRVVRRNKVRQAISAWRAATSGTWHTPTSDGTRAPEPSSVSMGAIPEVLLQLIAEDWLWETHLAQTDIPCHLVEYEAFTSNRRGTIEAVATFLGLSLSPDFQPSNTLRPMADAWTDAIERSVWDELASPEHPFWGSPALRPHVQASLDPDTVPARPLLPWKR